MSGRKKIGLALGAGAFRGLAHLGVLQVFQEKGFDFDAVAGTSAGALFAALYAAGNDFYVLEKLARELREGQLVDLAVPRWGLIRGERIEALVRTLTRGLTFAEMKVPLYVVAVDVEKGELVVLDRGRVADAVRASIAMPGLFVPKRLEGRLLVDGAVMAPVPVEVLRQRGIETVVAVDVHYTVTENEGTPVNNLFELFSRSLAIMGRAVCCRSLEQAALVIRPEVGHLSPARLHDAGEYIERGRRAALAALPRLEDIMKGWV